MKTTKTILAACTLASCLSGLAGVTDISSSSPLYPYSRDSEGKPLKKFKVPYAVVEEYFATSTGGLLGPVKSEVQLGLKNKQTLNKPKDELMFEVNLNKRHIAPVEELAPESAQGLFSFDVDRFIELAGTKDFVSAKKNYYANLDFDKETQSFDRQFLYLSDWKSLIHPPIKDVSDMDKYYQIPKEIPKNSEMLTASFNEEMDKLTGSELTTGNKTKLLVNNHSFHEKLAQVKMAKRSILVGVMSFAADPSSFELIDALIAKKKEGVDVQIILEKLWTTTVFRRSMERITKGGLTLLLANDMYRLKETNRGLFHNKVWIFDEAVAIVGGQNIVNSSNNSTGFNHWNKDTDVLIEGPMVTDILKEYLVLKERFNKVSEKKQEYLNLKDGASVRHYQAIVERKLKEERARGLRGVENYGKWMETEAAATSGNCRFIIQGPQRDKNALSKAYIKYFGAAQDRILFTSQHIEYEMELPSNDLPWGSKIYETLFNRGKAGVKIDLIANGIDGGFAEIGQNIASGEKSEWKKRQLERKFRRQEKRGQEPTTFMRRLSGYLSITSTKKFAGHLDSAAREENFNAWMHFQYIHSKTALVDNVMASIGSFNFEPYSAEKSHESAIFCYDRRLALDLRQDNIRDIVNSTPVFPARMVE